MFKKTHRKQQQKIMNGDITLAAACQSQRAQVSRPHWDNFEYISERPQCPAVYFHRATIVPNFQRPHAQIAKRSIADSLESVLTEIDVCIGHRRVVLRPGSDKRCVCFGSACFPLFCGTKNFELLNAHYSRLNPGQFTHLGIICKHSRNLRIAQ